ncbi:MAG: hypothetical protein ABC585_03965 [Candidatus Methanosuratincola petrocarbonis]
MSTTPPVRADSMFKEDRVGMIQDLCCEAVTSKSKKDRGFALTATALVLTLILLSAGFVIASMAWPGVRIGLDSDLANLQMVRSLLRNAGAHSSKTGDPVDAEAYINEFVQRSANGDLKRLIPGPNGTGYTAIPGILDFGIYKTRSGSDETGAVSVEGLPAGAYAIVADTHGDVWFAGPAEAGMPLQISTHQPVTEAYLVVYSPESLSWRYPQTGDGVLSASYAYTVSYSSLVINASAYSPPPGFAYLRVCNVPPLALVLVEDSTGVLKGAGWKSPADMAAVDGVQEVQVYVTGMPFTGVLRVLEATAWVKTDITGGDVFLYTNNYGE